MFKKYSCPKCGKRLPFKYIIKGGYVLDKKGKEMLVNCDSCNVEIIIRQAISTQTSLGLGFIIPYIIGTLLIYNTDKKLLEIFLVMISVWMFFFVFMYMPYYIVKMKITLK